MKIPEYFSQGSRSYMTDLGEEYIKDILDSSDEELIEAVKDVINSMKKEHGVSWRVWLLEELCRRLENKFEGIEPGN